MKKMKFFLGTIAIVAIGSAYTLPTTDPECATSQQFVKNLDGTYTARTIGMGSGQITCENEGVCTYYKPDPIGQPNLYEECLEGTPVLHQ